MISKKTVEDLEINVPELAEVRGKMAEKIKEIRKWQS